jgi:hypothetical protein
MILVWSSRNRSATCSSSAFLTRSIRRVTSHADASALLRFAGANGFLIAAVAGLARTLMSDYRRLRTRLGLTQYEEAAMLEDLKVAGFGAQRADKNIGHD